MRKKLFKTLELISLLVLICVVSFVLFYFMENSTKPYNQAQKALPLKKNVKSLTNSVDYLESRNGKPFLRVIAEKNVAFEGNINHLKTVKAIYYGKTGNEKTGTILADSGKYSSTENQVVFDGHVQINIKNSYTIKTSHVVYSKNSDIVKGSDNFSFVSKDIQGSGNGFLLDLKQKHLKILSNSFVRYTTADRVKGNPGGENYITVSSKTGEFWEKSGRAIFKGNASFVDPLSTLSGNKIELVFTPDHHLRKMNCTGDSAYKRVEAKKTVELRGEYIDFDFDPITYNLRAINTNENASLKSNHFLLEANQIKLEGMKGHLLQKLFSEGSVTLHSPEIEHLYCEKLSADFDPQGNIRQIISLNKCSLIKKEKNKLQIIEGDSIVFNFNAIKKVPSIKSLRVHRANRILIQTIPKRKIEGYATDLIVTYDNKGMFIHTLKASHQCQWTFKNREKNELISLKCDDFKMLFFQNSNDPMSFFADGRVNVHRIASGGMESYSSSDHLKGYVDNVKRQKIDYMIQKGNFIYKDSHYMAKSGTALFKNSIVSLTTKPSIKNEDTTTSSEKIVLNSKNKIVTGIKNVESVVKSTKEKTKSLSWMGRDQSIPLYIHADKVTMDNNKKRVLYSGSCRMVKGKNVLTANIITLDQKKNIFTAKGNVFLLYFSSLEPQKKNQPMQVICANLKYSPLTHILTMKGKVSIQRGGTVLKAKIIRGFITESKRISKLVALDKVVIHQGERYAYGDRALYIIKKEETILQGSPATVIDRKEGRTTEGAQLTFYKGNDKILVQNSRQLLQIKWSEE